MALRLKCAFVKLRSSTDESACSEIGRAAMHKLQQQHRMLTREMVVQQHESTQMLEGTVQVTGKKMSFVGRDSKKLQTVAIVA